MAKISELKVGKRVLLHEDALGGRIEADVVEVNKTNLKSKTGKQIGLKLSRHCAVGHECDGKVEQGYGWWAVPEQLTVIES